MSINERIIKALNPLGLSVTPDTHRPEQGDLYITFGYNVNGANYGDDVPQVEVYAVMVHLWAARGENVLHIRRMIRYLMAQAGFTWPDEVDGGDEDGQHYIYECQISEWIGGGKAWQE